MWIAPRSKAILIGIIGKRAFASHLITIITRYDMLVLTGPELAFSTGYFMGIQADNSE
jgi:hypothetical protein